MSEQTAPPEEYKNHLAPGKDWNKIVAWVGDLPPLPHIASQAIVLVEDPDTNAGQLSNLLGKDTALAARVLKIANSAMFSFQREITTLNQAVMIIGFKTLKGVIVAAALRQLNRKQGEIENVVWQNSIATASTAHVLARHLRLPFADEAFLLGLLHDLGKLVLIRQIPNDYAKIIERTKQGVFFVVAEQDMLGFAHPLIGALVAKKWNFSPDSCQVILHHHDPLNPTLKTELEYKTALIQFSDQIAHSLGYGHFPGYPEIVIQGSPLAQALKLDEKSLEKIYQEVAQTIKEQGSAFG